jgi:ABC-type nitrate/sulfonate/bicarbonate transport system substrate-binding protein
MKNYTKLLLMRNQHENKCFVFKMLAIVVVACFPLVASSAEKNLARITIGISPFQDTLLPIIGKEKGWFESEGLDVVFKMLAWNAMMPAVASNGVDLAVYNTTGVVAVYNKQPDITFWYPWNIFTQGAALMGRPNIGPKDGERL